MKIELTEEDFRHLLDLVYVGNWIMNSIRGLDRLEGYDAVESKIFSHCKDCGMESFAEKWHDMYFPSREFCEGGIEEAVMNYEDAVFYDLLAEELAHRDMNFAPISPQNYDELVERMDEYIEEFENYGTDRLQLMDT